jgi:deuterolysin
MLSLIAFSNFVFLANALCLDGLHKRQIDNTSSPLDVRIEMAGNSVVKATITNTGNEHLRVLKTGSFLAKSATEKLRVFEASTSILISCASVDRDLSLANILQPRNTRPNPL